MNKSEELIMKTANRIAEYFNGDTCTTPINDTVKKLYDFKKEVVNSAVLEKDIKIDILEQEVDSWKNVFSKELVEEQKEKDAKIAKSKKYKEVETFYQNGINSVIEKIAKEILEQ